MFELPARQQTSSLPLGEFHSPKAGNQKPVSQPGLAEIIHQ
jgi:hypothetical protein